MAMYQTKRYGAFLKSHVYKHACLSAKLHSGPYQCAPQEQRVLL